MAELDRFLSRRRSGAQDDDEGDVAPVTYMVRCHSATLVFVLVAVALSAATLGVAVTCQQHISDMERAHDETNARLYEDMAAIREYLLRQFGQPNDPGGFFANTRLAHLDRMYAWALADHPSPSPTASTGAPPPAPV